MLKLHKKIINEIVKEKKKDPKIVSIFLFGSLARGTAHEKSDVDIEIIHKGNKYRMLKEKRYGIKIDIEIWPKEKLEKRIKKYPYLSYPYLEEKILYDPTGFAKKIKKYLKQYFKKNPGPLKEWENWKKAYLKFKKKRIERKDWEKIGNMNKFYNMLERKFSESHKVTRDF